MFSLRICRYSMSKLMIEVLKMVKSVKLGVPRDLTKKFAPGDLTVFENLPGVVQGGGLTL